MQKVETCDIAIIGAGVVGAAVASQLAKKNRKIIVLESCSGPGESTSGRNSGVIHSGVYYPQSFLKTSLCVQGQALLYEWLEKKSIAYRKVGKFIVATEDSQIQTIENQYQRAIENGCQNFSLLTAKQVESIAPEIRSPLAALHMRETGIVDPKNLTNALIDDAASKDVTIRYNSKVVEIQKNGSQDYIIKTPTSTYQASLLINSAGLYADKIAFMAGISKYKIYPCRGDYFKIKGHFPLQHLVYPAKTPHAAGLGIHLTVDMDGQGRFGPDAEYIEDPGDTSKREEKQEIFAEAAHKLIRLPKEIQLTYAGFGIRPKLYQAGQREVDFVIAKDSVNLLNLVGIESPGLTSCLAIARYVEKIV